MINSAIRISGSIFLVALALQIGAPAARSEQQCPTLPVVRWWNDIDQKNMTAYVDARHGGDWDAYIAKWQDHLVKMRAIYSKGGSVASKKRGVRITGGDLYDYIAAVEQRLTVTRCRANLEMAAAARKLEDLETASGGEDPIPETVR